MRNCIEIYPFGMPMPNRKLTGPEQYRYTYQGQEIDPETGKEAFQLRLWDGRIGRWLTTDPAGEFFSPYLGMGNNPISVIDPDGGCTTCPDDAKIGDTFNHSEYGNLTFTDTGWASPEFGNILDDVMISGQGSGLSGIAGVRFEQWKQIIEPDFNHRRSESAKYMAEHPVFQIMMFMATSGGASASSGLINVGSKSFSKFVGQTSSRVFWSGGSKVAGKAAENFAKSNGSKTLEMTLQGKALNKLTNLTSYNLTKPLWNYASKQFAKGAHGRIHVFQNAVEGVRIESVWAKVEYQILKDQNIIYHNLFK